MKINDFGRVWKTTFKAIWGRFRARPKCRDSGPAGDSINNYKTAINVGKKDCTSDPIHLRRQEVKP